MPTLETTHMGRAELASDIADLIIEKLSASVIPSSFPAEIGEWVRQTAGHGSYVWRFSIPMAGATAMCTDWTLNPDGTINLELQDTCGHRFWRGTFRPAEMPRDPLSHQDCHAGESCKVRTDADS